MVEISKYLFEKACSNVDCSTIVHPFHPTCLGSLSTLVKKSFIGSAKFYSIVYMIQIVIRGKKMLRIKEQTAMVQYYLRSTLLGGLASIGILSFSCLLRWRQGNKFSYYSYALVPATLSGVFIYLEPSTRRSLIINLFCNLVIEYWLRTLQTKGYLALTKTKKTFMFMTGSSLLLYLMRLEGKKEKRTPLLWLCIPENVRKLSSSLSPCPHNDSCLTHILKGFSIYFGIGLLTSLGNDFLSKGKSAIKVHTCLRRKSFNMAFFLGSYIAIYRAVICYFCQQKGHDSTLYALPAGFLAGVAFLFNPNIKFAIASLTGTIKLYLTILYDKKILPENIPLPEIIYCFCQGILVHASVMHSKDCPSYVYNLVSSVSGGCFDLAYKGLQEVVKRSIT